MVATFNARNPSVKRIQQEIREFSRDPSADVLAEALEEDIFEWHFVVRGAKDSDFEGGLYHGRILLPAEYPFKPPAFLMLTPNGRFETGQKVCLSISSHHPEHWQPSWSVRTALLALIAFMQTPGDGAIASLDYSPDDRRELARLSRMRPPVYGPKARQDVTDAAHATMLQREADMQAPSNLCATSSATLHSALQPAASQIETPGQPASSQSATPLQQSSQPDCTPPASTPHATPSPTTTATTTTCSNSSSSSSSSSIQSSQQALPHVAPAVQARDDLSRDATTAPFMLTGASKELQQLYAGISGQSSMPRSVDLPAVTAGRASEASARSHSTAAASERPQNGEHRPMRIVQRSPAGPAAHDQELLTMHSLRVAAQHLSGHTFRSWEDVGLTAAAVAIAVSIAAIILKRLVL